MKRLVAVALVLAAVVAAPAAASPTFRMTILHYVRGCHVWEVGSKNLGPKATVTLKTGTRLEIRASCPMDFMFRQVGGPKVVPAPGRLYAGNVYRVVLRRPGTYKLSATNLQSAAQQGLQTLGPDNSLALTIIVR